jgi:hypothetical protein
MVFSHNAKLIEKDCPLKANKSCRRYRSASAPTAREKKSKSKCLPEADHPLGGKIQNVKCKSEYRLLTFTFYILHFDFKLSEG